MFWSFLRNLLIQWKNSKFKVWNLFLGRYPWHVAINQDFTGEMKYACGGSLISQKHILTAAHCTTQDAQPLRPNQFEVILGNELKFLS